MINRLKKQVLRTYQYSRMVNSGGLENYECYVVDDDHHLRLAKRLHADTYLKRGFVSKEHIDDLGHISINADPHQDHSVYFVVIKNHIQNPSVVLTARQIREHASLGIKSFPILEQAHIYPKYKSIIERHKPDEITEISGLAKQSGEPTAATLILYRFMGHYSLAKGDKLWLMACAPALYERLKNFFGPSVVQIGERTEYVGEDIIPAMVDIDRAVQWLEKATSKIHPVHRPLSRFVLDPPEIKATK